MAFSAHPSKMLVATKKKTQGPNIIQILPSQVIWDKFE